MDAETSGPTQPVSRDRETTSVGIGHATLECQRTDTKHQNVPAVGNHATDNDIFRMREHVKVSDL